MRYLTRMLSLTASTMALAAPFASSTQRSNSTLADVLCDDNRAVCRGTGSSIIGATVSKKSIIKLDF